MTKIAIVPNAAGTGTFTIEAPNSNSNRTLVLPDAAGEIYGQGNILGTVSQSAGVPTGAIIERGSNANGEFVKYADGTMICHHIIDGPNTLGTNGNFDVSLPSAFTNTAYSVSALVTPSGTASTADSFELVGNSVRFAGNFVIRLGIPSTGSRRPTAYVVDNDISYAAIGRWF
jgi:hypothetical protein